MTLPAWRVLVVEDEAMIRMLTADMLDVLGMSCMEAGLASEAVLAAKSQGGSIDAALVDLGLPDRSGQDLIHDLRAILPGLPIVVISGRDESALTPATRALSALAFLEKPFDLGQLERVLNQIAAA
jgi:DNA-binding response OmpR family regulator